MKKEDLNLKVIDFGDADEALTVHGAIYHPVDLTEIEKAGREISARVMLMRCMNLICITLADITIHINGTGEIVVNGVSSIEEAENILLRLSVAL